MVGWIILAVLAALILLVFFVPYGVDVSYAGDVFRLGIKAGPVRVWLLPKKPLTERQKRRAAAKQAKKESKREAKAAKKAAAAQEKEVNDTVTVKPKRKLDFDTILALLRMGSHAIRRFFRSFTVDFFQLHYTVACRDPYDTAVQYGMVCAAVEALPALAGKTIRVLRRDIEIGADYTAEEPAVSVRIVLSLQLFRLVHMAFALGAEFVKWKINSRRDDPAAAVKERKDDNGREQDQCPHGYDGQQDPAAG